MMTSQLVEMSSRGPSESPQEVALSLIDCAIAMAFGFDWGFGGEGGGGKRDIAGGVSMEESARATWLRWRVLYRSASGDRRIRWR